MEIKKQMSKRECTCARYKLSPQQYGRTGQAVKIGLGANGRGAYMCAHCKSVYRVRRVLPREVVRALRNRYHFLNQGEEAA